MKLSKCISAMFIFTSLLNCSPSERAMDNMGQWVKDSVTRELGITLPLDALSIVQKFQLDTVHPVIIATVKIDQLNGGIFIYQWVENKYQLKYKRAEPVYNVQYGPGSHLVFESGFTGTGQKNTNFYLLELNQNTCKEVWHGPASVYNFTSVAPYHSTDGSVQLNTLDESFIYTTIKQTFLKTEFDPNKPDSIVSHSQMLRFKDF